MTTNFATNPPEYDGIKGGTGSDGTPVTYGTILKYGLDGVTVTGLLVDSYSRSIKYANKDEIVGQNGVVQGVRMSDARVELSVSGRILNSGTFAKAVGGLITLGLDTGIIEDMNLSAGTKEFTKVDIKATCYEGVTGANPNMIT